MTLIVDPRLPWPVWAVLRAPFEAFAERHDGRWSEAAVLQPLNRLLDLAGEDMRARLFVVQGEGGEELALRPDFTIPIAVAHLASGREEGRYLYEGKAFRSTPAGSGRASEFQQIGAEAFGPTPDPALQDAEIAALAWQAAAAGGRDDLSLTLGDAGLFAAFVRAMGLPEGMAAKLVRAFPNPRTLHAELGRAQASDGPAQGGRLAAILADLPEAEATEVLAELWRLAGIQPVGGRSAADIAHRLAARAAAQAGPRLSPAEAALIARYLAVAGAPESSLDAVDRLACEAGLALDGPLQGWSRRLQALAQAGVPGDRMTLATGYVRPFGYYDGVLFEVRSAALAADQPLAAGGRYDGLLARLGGTGAPGAVGCVVRPGRAWRGM